MGLFDFLKITVGGTRKKRAPAKPKKPINTSKNVVEIDGKRFPLAAITDKGFVVGQFDGSLIRGQNAHLTVIVDDELAKLTFTTTVGVTEVKDGKMVAQWNLITPEMANTLRTYNQRKRLHPPK